MFFLIFLFHSAAWSEINDFKKIYLDKKRNVHLVTSVGRDMKLTKGGRATRVALSTDRHTASWLIENSWIAEGDDGPGSSVLKVYRDGKLRSIECAPFIREYWFWEGGRQVAIFCGGRHFAGTFSLYDVTTGQLIESFYQTDIPEEKRPAWSLPGNSYHPAEIN